MRVGTSIGQFNFGATVYYNEQYFDTEWGTAEDFSSTSGLFRDDGAGFIASAASQAAWTFNPSNPGLGTPVTGLSFSGSASASIVTPGLNTDEFVNTGFGMSLYLELSTETQWALGGHFAASMQSAVGATYFNTGWQFQILDLDNSPFPGSLESSMSITDGYMTFTPIPAPAVLSLLGIGLLGTTRRRR